VLRAIGGEVLYLGPVGSASTMKVITNLLAFVHIVAAGEAMMLAQRAGLDPVQAFGAIRASSGNSFVHETETPLVLDGTYDIGFTMDLACKDLSFARALGEELDVPLALGNAAGEAFAQARERYGGDAWSTMVVKLLEDAVGTEIRPSPGRER
jgi:3-hydroxyisobutyrate dehydrogenase-like beta-hydroxyacid dehydrogenase